MISIVEEMAELPCSAGMPSNSNSIGEEGIITVGVEELFSNEKEVIPAMSNVETSPEEKGGLPSAETVTEAEVSAETVEKERGTRRIRTIYGNVPLKRRSECARRKSDKASIARMDFGEETKDSMYGVTCTLEATSTYFKVVLEPPMSQWSQLGYI